MQPKGASPPTASWPTRPHALTATALAARAAMASTSKARDMLLHRMVGLDFNCKRHWREWQPQRSIMCGTPRGVAAGLPPKAGKHFQNDAMTFAKGSGWEIGGRQPAAFIHDRPLAASHAPRSTSCRSGWVCRLFLASCVTVAPEGCFGRAAGAAVQWCWRRQTAQPDTCRGLGMV